MSDRSRRKASESTNGGVTGARGGLVADLRAASVPWVVARVLVGASLATSRFVFDEIGRGPRPNQLHQGLFAWDAAFYREIADHGYDALPRAALRFFPLVPLGARGLGAVLLGHPDVALLLIANCSALVFAALLHRLALLETGDAGLARRATWFAALLPAASVFVLGYADATALALATGAFLALRTRWLATAGALGFLAGLSRPSGVLLAVPAALEILRDHRHLHPAEWPRRALAVAGPMVGLGSYLAWVGSTRGDPWLPFSVQQRASLRGHVVDPVSRLVDAARDWLVHGRVGEGLHLLWAIGFLALLVVVARRLPASYTAYSALTLLVGLSAENLDSFERYAMGAFPLLLALAALTHARDAERAGLTLAAGGLVAYTVLAFFGASVP